MVTGEKGRPFCAMVYYLNADIAMVNAHAQNTCFLGAKERSTDEKQAVRTLNHGKVI